MLPLLLVRYSGKLLRRELYGGKLANSLLCCCEPLCLQAFTFGTFEIQYPLDVNNDPTYPNPIVHYEAFSTQGNDTVGLGWCLGDCTQSAGYHLLEYYILKCDPSNEDEALTDVVTDMENYANATGGSLQDTQGFDHNPFGPTSENSDTVRAWLADADPKCGCEAPDAEELATDLRSFEQLKALFGFECCA